MARGETRDEAAVRRAAPPVEQTRAPAPAKPMVDQFCGIRKVGPSAYAVVTGQLVDGKVVTLQVDPVVQPLDHTAQTLAMKLRAMIGEMP